MSQYYDVVAISSGDGLEEALLEQGGRGYRIDMTRQITPLKDLLALFQLIKVLRKEKPDIVHTHTPKAGVLGMLGSMDYQSSLPFAYCSWSTIISGEWKKKEIVGVCGETNLWMCDNGISKFLCDERYYSIVEFGGFSKVESHR